MKKRLKNHKLWGLRRYWPHLTLKEAVEERLKLWKKQDGKCAICGKDEKMFKRRLNVDHNHKSGQVRGLLCYRCNKFQVGRHSYESALKVLKYLEVERGNL